MNCYICESCYIKSDHHLKLYLYKIRHKLCYKHVMRNYMYKCLKYKMQLCNVSHTTYMRK